MDKKFSGIEPGTLSSILTFLSNNDPDIKRMIEKNENDIEYNSSVEDKKQLKKLPKPREIVDFLNQHVIGQNELKKTLAVAVYNHYKRIFNTDYSNKKYQDVTIEKSNVLVLGNTGTGKTFTVKTIAKMLGVPCFIADCTKLTEAGYVGDDVETILFGLLQTANYDMESAQKGIIILDEIDKISRKGENVSITRDVSGEGVQQGLLKIVEGGKIGISPRNNRKNPNEALVYIDTTNILFIGLGAFDGIDNRIRERMHKKSTIGFKHEDTIIKEEENILNKVTTDDIKKYGIIPELLGRFPIITHTNPLTKKDLVKILTEPKNSIIKQYEKLLDMDNVKLVFSKKSLEYIAEVALNKNTGARGLRGIIENILIDIMYEYADKPGKEIKISEKFIKHKIKNIEEKVA